MQKIFTWIRAARPAFFTGSLIPVMVGAALSFHKTGRFNLGMFMAVLLGAIFIHAGLNFANDYYDHKSGTDEKNMNYSSFSGGSRFIQNGILPPSHILIMSMICFSSGSAIGLYLNFILPGNIILFLGVCGIFLAFFYTSPPLKIGYTGLGELATAIGFGPLMITGSYYSQSRSMSQLPLMASVPIAILIGLVILINEFPDYESDKISGKKTLVVLFGKKKSALIFCTMIFSVYIYVSTAVYFSLLPVHTLLIVLTLPLAVTAVLLLAIRYKEPRTILVINAITIALHSAAGILLTIGFVVSSK